RSIHRILDDSVEGAGEPGLIDVMLILSDADRLRVDLHELGKRVLQAPCDRHGVDLNTASASLLSRVSGLSASLAAAIIVHRDQKGAFNCRRDILGVARLGARAFELCAGFLRIPNGS